MSLVQLLLVLFANFQIEAKGTTLKQVFYHPFTISMVILIILIFLRLPGLSLGISAVNFFFLLMIAYKCGKKLMEI